MRSFLKKLVAAGILIAFLFPQAAFAASTPPSGEEEAAQNKIAWDRYEKGDYQGAYDVFTRLLEQRPLNEGYSLGFAYSALKTGRLDDALSVAEKFDGGKSDFTRIRLDIYNRKGQSAFERKDYKEASFFLAKVLEATPDDAGAAELLAWSLYNGGRLEEALALFEGLYAKTKDVRLAEIILIIYDRKGDVAKVYALAGELSTRDEKQKAIAADYFFKIGCPVTAAGTSNRSASCFYNANGAWFASSATFRYKSGDEGTSKVRETYAVLSYSRPFGYGQTLGLSIKPAYMTSGQAPANLFEGSFFRNVPQKNKATTSTSSIEPRITFEKEAGPVYTLSAGTTPIGGEMPALPVFSMAVKTPRWGLDLHQSSVDESVLSRTGLKDPYADAKWGRVVKTGAQAWHTSGVFSDYWLSLKAGYDYYHGGNVLNNYAYAGTAAFGRTFQAGDWDVSAGAFATARRFKYNTNFFTFGHGGYFSPQRFLAAGPVLSLKTKPCRTYVLDAEFAVSYLNYRTKNARRYPLEKTGAWSAEEFNGERSTGIGYSAGVKGLWLIQNRIGAGGNFKIDKSADYTEWKAVVELKAFFEPRSSVAFY